MHAGTSTGAGAAPFGGFGVGGLVGFGGFGGLGVGGLGGLVGFGWPDLPACCAATLGDAFRVGVAAAVPAAANTPATNTAAAPMTNHRRFLITITSVCCDRNVDDGDEHAVGDEGGIHVVAG